MRWLAAAVLLTSVVWGQTAAEPAATQAPGAGASQAASNPSAQMRADLNQMESLLNNMSSEVTFLRDQNLQILLNTNVRMWTILIRDLRLQLDQQEKREQTSQGKPKGEVGQKPH